MSYLPSYSNAKVGHENPNKIGRCPTCPTCPTCPSCFGQFLFHMHVRTHMHIHHAIRVYSYAITTFEVGQVGQVGHPQLNKRFWLSYFGVASRTSRTGCAPKWLMAFPGLWKGATRAFAFEAMDELPVSSLASVT